MPAIPVTQCALHEVNDALAQLRDGRVIGRMVLVTDAEQHLGDRPPNQ